MPDTDCPTPADPELAVAALRYAAGEMVPAEAEAFEARLGDDQTAREALAEAVRLSAAASGLPAPTPDPLTRRAAAERLAPTWLTRLFPRRPYRGHPAVWAGLGGGLAAAAAVVITLNATPAPPPPVARALPEVIALSVAPVGVEGEAEQVIPLTRVPPSDPTVGPKLNPMGLDQRAGDTLGVAYPMPMAGEPTPPVPAAKPADEKLAEGVNDPNPMTDPHIGGMMTSKL